MTMAFVPGRDPLLLRRRGQGVVVVALASGAAPLDDVVLESKFERFALRETLAARRWDDPAAWGVVPRLVCCCLLLWFGKMILLAQWRESIAASPPRFRPTGETTTWSCSGATSFRRSGTPCLNGARARAAPASSRAQTLGRCGRRCSSWPRRDQREACPRADDDQEESRTRPSCTAQLLPRTCAEQVSQWALSTRSDRSHPDGAAGERLISDSSFVPLT